MDKLQYLLYADGNLLLLVVLQALDAASKNGVVRHLFSGMNPQGTSVFGFKQPIRVCPQGRSGHFQPFALCGCAGWTRP
jgi:polyphosphate kinase 2 (PPK2 family)